MPVSRVELVKPVIDAVRECDRLHGVSSVLDVGCGTGFYGAALRQYLDFAYNRIEPSEQRLLIDGIEPFGGYETPDWRHYDNIYGGEAQAFLEDPDEKVTYDVVLACDVLEHMELAEAERVARELYARTAKFLIITTPSTFRKQWQPDKPWANPLEEHRCQITPAMLDAWFPRVRVQDYGSVFIAVVQQEFLPV